MSLYYFHRVLIVATIVFDFFFTLWSIRMWRETSEPTYIYLAVGSSILTLAFIAYLVYFNRKLPQVKQNLEQHPPTSSKSSPEPNGASD